MASERRPRSRVDHLVRFTHKINTSSSDRHRAFPVEKPRPGPVTQKNFPLPLDRASFESLSEKIKLPKSFLRSLERAGPVYESMDIECETVDPLVGNGVSDFHDHKTLC